MTEGKAVGQQPLKGTPRRMDFHCGFQPGIVRLHDVGIASSNMRVHHTVLSLQIFKKLSC